VTNEQIYAQLTDVFHDVFDDTSIRLSPDTAAPDVPGWDSLNHVNLIAATELRFGIRFKTAELESLHNVGQLVDVISSKAK
jgi:acyl carrier protein